jgi:hypothetical protein
VPARVLVRLDLGQRRVACLDDDAQLMPTANQCRHGTLGTEHIGCPKKPDTMWGPPCVFVLRDHVTRLLFCDRVYPTSLAEPDQQRRAARPATSPLACHRSILRLYVRTGIAFLAIRVRHNPSKVPLPGTLPAPLAVTGIPAPYREGPQLSSSASEQLVSATKGKAARCWRDRAGRRKRRRRRSWTKDDASWGSIAQVEMLCTRCLDNPAILSHCWSEIPRLAGISYCYRMILLVAYCLGKIREDTGTPRTRSQRW